MSDFQLMTGDNVPEVPQRQAHGRYDALLEQARAAGGEFIAIRAKDDDSAKKLSSIGSRINRGKVKNTQAGEYEARVSVKDRTMWVKWNGPMPTPQEETVPELPPVPAEA